MYMIPSKNSGFTLIEVLLAGALIGIALGPIYFMQGTVYDQVLRMIQRVERFFVGYDFLLDAQADEQERVNETLDNPKTELIYEASDPKGALAKEFNHLRLQKATWRWKVQQRAYEDTFVSFFFAPPEEKPQAEQGGAA